MKLAAIFLLAGCVTSGDLREVEASIAELREHVGDNAALRAKIVETETKIEAVAVNAENRTQGFVDALVSPAGGGVAGAVSAVSMVALNLYRNRTRRKLIHASR